MGRSQSLLQFHWPVREPFCNSLCDRIYCVTIELSFCLQLISDGSDAVLCYLAERGLTGAPVRVPAELVLRQLPRCLELLPAIAALVAVPLQNQLQQCNQPHPANTYLNCQTDTRGSRGARLRGRGLTWCSLVISLQVIRW